MRLWAEISASSFSQNLEILRQLVYPAEIMLVVKANAYGHGLEIVAGIAEKKGIKWVGVTSASEAEAVLKSSYRGNIFCFFEPENSEEAEFLVRNNIATNLFTEKSLELLLKASAKIKRKARVHIKVNTGMNRLGAKPETVLGFLDRVVERKEIAVEGLWTHLATSELPDDEFVKKQLSKFFVVAEQAKRKLQKVVLHAANTGGALYYPKARLNLVRIGIGAYGYYPSFNSPRIYGLKPVLKLKARITALTQIESGEGVSYGLKWKAKKPSYIGIVAAGYADGIPYSASGKLKVRYKDREYFQVGSVCMDQFAVDFEETIPNVGDEVEVIYEGQTAEDIARAAQTITYEVLTGLGTRVSRIQVD